MKKVFLSLAVVCSVALVSCGGNKAAEAADAAADSANVEIEEAVAVVADSIAPDSVAVDTVAAVAAQVVNN